MLPKRRPLCNARATGPAGYYQEMEGLKQGMQSSRQETGLQRNSRLAVPGQNPAAAGTIDG
jgi:hypothetical protein